MSRPSATSIRRILTVVLALIIAGATLVRAPGLAQASQPGYTELSLEERDNRYSHARLGVVSGALTELKLIEQYPDADIQLFQSEPDVIAALAGNKIDYAFVSEFYANRYMEQNSGYEYITPMYITFDDCFVIQKGADELREKFNEVLERYREDGTLDAINKKWVVDRNYTMEGVPTCDTGSEVLRVATSGTEEPYTFIMNGEQVGLAPEIIQRIASELGMRVEYVNMDLASKLAAVVAGKVDMATQLCSTEERRKQVDFTDVYVTLNYGALARAQGTEATGLFDNLADNFNSTFVTENRWQLVLEGLGATCLITAGSFATGTLLAALLCWLSRRKSRVARGLTKLYSKLACGVPVLVWLMVLYYVVFAQVDMPAIIVAIICFGLQCAVPICEVFATGLKGVDKGQVEAALAMGFSPLQTFKLVVLPQAASGIWPLYSAQLTTLIKGTSIVGYVAIRDLTKVSDIIRSRTFQAFFPLLATAIVYFLLIALCSWALSRLGRLLNPKRRKPATVLKGIQAE